MPGADPAARRICFTSAPLRGWDASTSRRFLTRTPSWRLPSSTIARHAVVAADLLNDRGIPFFDQQEVALSRILTDRGTEYCGAPERHEYELYLAVKTRSHPDQGQKSADQRNAVERFHRTVLNEFYRVAFRTRFMRISSSCRAHLDLRLREYNELRPHQGRWCYTARPRGRPSATACRWRRRRRPRATLPAVQEQLS